ncbi:MAG: thiamine biosynthesis protein ThiS [Prochlorococcus sp. SP3034]|nr:thiamine biosynthesis protein ThiS [Prochlorococcus sp. SP3034]|tara:strand:+ start:8583 stop:8792 length:210 start_codon:yes stop_codon:yes gene_type:complete
MKIKVNGEEKYLNTEEKLITLSETINSLGYKSNTIVVELNNLIVNYEGWGKENVKEGDRLEIVSIVGGG